MKKLSFNLAQLNTFCMAEIFSKQIVHHQLQKLVGPFFRLSHLVEALPQLHRRIYCTWNGMVWRINLKKYFPYFKMWLGAVSSCAYLGEFWKCTPIWSQFFNNVDLTNFRFYRKYVKKEPGKWLEKRNEHEDGMGWYGVSLFGGCGR